MDCFEIFIRFGEIALKSPSVRYRMEKQLAKNIRKFLKKIGLAESDVSIKRSWGRVDIHLEPKSLEETSLTTTEVARLLAESVYGIVSTSPVYRVTLPELEKVALSLAAKRLQPKSSFAVRVRRFGTHDFTSKDIEVQVGGAICEAFKDREVTVDLTNPDYLLRIEIKNELAFVFDATFQGFGGFPQGVQGTVVSILRGSVEDAIAAFLLCKRGAITIPIAFEVKNFREQFSNERELQQQIDYFQLIQPQKSRYFKVNFNSILEKIGLENLTCNICDKICIKIANKIVAEQYKKGITLGNASRAVTYWEPQVNTLPDPPVYYPLIALNKDAIAHPFKEEKYKSGFCLANCPGLENQKKKKEKQLSEDEIAQIAAQIEYQLISADSLSS